MNSGTVKEAEEMLDTPQGRRFFLSTKFPLLDETGNVVGICGMATDITERKTS
jgi:hypothetical protein